MTKKIDPDLKALKAAGKALEKSTSRHMLEANLNFLWDRFITHPGDHLPEHLRVNWISKGRKTT
jgi:hypothetical protein